MKVQTQAMWMLFATLVIFITAITLFQILNLNQKQLLMLSNKQNHTIVVDNILKNTTARINQIAKDYSGWDEMVEFVSSSDSAWASENIDLSVSSYDVDFFSVYDSLGNHIYTYADSSAQISQFIGSKKVIKEIFEKGHNPHFFWKRDNKIVEVCGELIVSSSDFDERKTSPKGFVLVGLNWNNDLKKYFENTSTFKLRLNFNTNSKTLEDLDKFTIISRELIDIDSNVVAIAEFMDPNPLFVELENTKRLSYTIVGVTMIAFILFFLFFRKLFTRPLQLISSTLDSQNTNNISILKKRKDEFGQISILINEFFIQQVDLKNANTILQQQKEEIETRNDMLHEQKVEIESQNHELHAQKDKMEKKNKEITDSINYAQHIQHAILSQSEAFLNYLGDHFIWLKPKDIVSGDFYWIKQVEHRLFIAAADCTGHGVPGAFMSLLGMSFLSEIVTENPNDNAANVLNHLREHVKESLGQTGRAGEQKDGMDMAICILDKSTLELQYSGANNSLLYVQNGMLNEIKADKMPVGVHIKDREKFTNHTLLMYKGDMIYLSSDGYKDQFGGQNKSKFLSKNFKDLLFINSHLDCNSQKEIIAETFENWKGKLNQLDDVLVVGIRI